MKTRTTAILIIIAIILTSLSLSVFKYTSNRWYSSSSNIGTTIFTQTEISAASKIIITPQHEKPVILEKKDEVWRVETDDNLPADKTKIIKLLDSLTNIKVVQNIYTDQIGIEKLSLSVPSKENSANSGTEIQLFINQEPLPVLIAGKYRNESNGINQSEIVIGRYMRFINSDDVFFTDQLLTELSYSSEDWTNVKKAK